MLRNLELPEVDFVQADAEIGTNFRIAGTAGVTAMERFLLDWEAFAGRDGAEDRGLDRLVGSGVEIGGHRVAAPRTVVPVVADRGLSVRHLIS